MKSFFLYEICPQSCRKPKYTVRIPYERFTELSQISREKEDKTET